MCDDIQKAVLVGRAYGVDPFLRDAESHEFDLAEIVEGLRPWDWCNSCRDVGAHRGCRRRPPLLDTLSYLDQLHGASCGMSLDPSALSPLVRLVMVIDVDQKQAGSRFVNNQPDIRTHAQGPEVGVLGSVYLVKLHARRGRVQLKIEGRHLHGLLLMCRQAGERIRKCVRDSKFHRKMP